MTRKFKSGDRVKIKQNSLACFFLTDGVDYVGTVIGYDDAAGDILVKFDNLTNGHDGGIFYSEKGIKYDPKNCQHLYVLEENLCLLEGED